MCCQGRPGSEHCAVTKLRAGAGRVIPQRVISHPLPIKGLEYDHALDPDAHAPTSLYVALTRARRTLTVVSGAGMRACRRCIMGAWALANWSSAMESW
jgi:hypothetical protein